MVIHSTVGNTLRGGIDIGSLTRLAAGGLGVRAGWGSVTGTMNLSRRKTPITGAGRRHPLPRRSGLAPSTHAMSGARCPTTGGTVPVRPGADVSRDHRRLGYRAHRGRGNRQPRSRASLPTLACRGGSCFHSSTVIFRPTSADASCGPAPARKRGAMARYPPAGQRQSGTGTSQVSSEAELLS